MVRILALPRPLWAGEAIQFAFGGQCSNPEIQEPRAEMHGTQAATAIPQILYTDRGLQA